MNVSWVFRVNVSFPILSIFIMILLSNVVKAGPASESEKASGDGSTRSNRSNRWLDRITVETECEAVAG